MSEYDRCTIKRQGGNCPIKCQADLIARNARDVYFFAIWPKPEIYNTGVISMDETGKEEEQE